jgi:hypothetical protein
MREVPPKQLKNVPTKMGALSYPQPAQCGAGVDPELVE